MSETPKVFQDFSIGEILAGRKTETRRLLAHQPRQRPSDGWLEFPKPLSGGITAVQDLATLSRYAPHRRGDLIWIREAYRVTKHDNGIEVAYKDGATRIIPAEAEIPERAFAGWGNPMFMPRAASRITLEVQRCWAERLWSISAEDAEAEGPCYGHITSSNPALDDTHRHYGAKGCFRVHWDSIKRKAGERYNDNPVVWATKFVVLHKAMGVRPSLHQ